MIERVLWVLVGVTVLIAGLAMIVLPGPAIFLIRVGLAMLDGALALAAMVAVGALTVFD